MSLNLKSIDDLKSSITSHGGLVMQNRFNVIFNPPTQALLNTNPANLVNSFLAGGGLKSFINDPRDLSLLAISSSIPGRQLQTAEHQTFRETKKYVTSFIDEDVTLEFLITQDFYIKTILRIKNMCYVKTCFFLNFSRSSRARAGPIWTRKILRNT